HRPKLDLLDLDDVLSFAGFGRLLLRLVLVLAVVQELDDGGRGVRGDLDKIEPRGLRHLERSLDWRRAVIVPGGIDQLNLADADLLVDARAVFLNGQRGFHRTANGS